MVHITNNNRKGVFIYIEQNIMITGSANQEASKSLNKRSTPSISSGLKWSFILSGFNFY